MLSVGASVCVCVCNAWELVVMVFAKGGTGEEKLVGRTYPHVPVIVVPLCVFLFAWVQYCVGVCVCQCAWEGVQP